MYAFSADKPVFLQIAEWIENEILRGNIGEGQRLPSQAEISKTLQVNPLTAAKGVSVLEARGVIEKKRRGLGIYVLSDAKSRIYEYRRNESLNAAVDDLLHEAEALGLSVNELHEILDKRYGEGKGE